MKFIQISGAAGAGKTTVANILFDKAFESNYIPVILPFAKDLKDEAALMGHYKDEDSDGYRKFCQQWCSQRREEDEYYWIKKVMDEVLSIKEIELQLRKSKQDRFEHLIIQDDVRFMNELIYGRKVGAYQLFVTTANRIIPDLFARWRAHESEELAYRVEVAKKDYTDIFDEYIENNLDYESLSEKIEERFYSWITEVEYSKDPITEMYREGLKPNEQFVFMSMMFKDKDTL
mgnify:FL=1